MAKAWRCPNAANHNSPSSEDLDYVAWHDWAERKSQTHHQVRCPGCNRFSIWVPNDPAVEEAGVDAGGNLKDRVLAKIREWIGGSSGC
jgi:hypothetical protein